MWNAAAISPSGRQGVRTISQLLVRSFGLTMPGTITAKSQRAQRGNEKSDPS
jgi:hypothetical protein